MNNRLFLRAVYAAAFGHCVALLFVVIATLFTVTFDDPSGAAFPVAMAAVASGALFCGIRSRKAGLGIAGGALSGVYYSVVLFLLSLFIGGSGYTLAVRFAVCLSSVMISLFAASVTSKKKRSGGSMYKRKKAMYKNLRQ